MLQYRATSATAPAVYDTFYSDPFTIDEIVAIKDDPESPFYIARTTAINATNISVHYHGCTTRDLDRAVFRPGWHAPGSNLVTLAATCPPGDVPCTGNLQLDSLRESLVARNLEFTNGPRLKKKSQRAITPKLADLFIF